MDFERQLIEEYPFVRCLCAKLLAKGSNTDMLDDLVQSVMVQAWRKRESFRGDSQLRTWLHTLATRCFYDTMRQKKLPTIPLIDQDRAQSSTVEGYLYAKEVLPQVDLAVAMLAAGHGEQEVAETTGIPRQQVRVKAHRARQQIREKFKE